MSKTKSNKINIVTIRLTNEEYDLISKDAESNGRSIGSEIRFQLFLSEKYEDNLSEDFI